MTLCGDQTHDPAANVASLNGQDRFSTVTKPSVAVPGRRLLVIDDQPGITRVVTLIATRMGIETKSVNLPNQALDAFLTFRPHVVMIDMIMPEKDGIDVLNEILLTGIAAHILLTSGFSDNYLRLAEALAKFHDNASCSVLRKPFRRNELVAELNRHMAVL